MSNLKQFALGGVIGLILGILFTLVVDYTPQVIKQANKGEEYRIYGTVDGRKINLVVTNQLPVSAD